MVLLIEFCTDLIVTTISDGSAANIHISMDNGFSQSSKKNDICIFFF